MLMYALVIRDSPWSKSADIVYNFLKVLILYEAQHIISKIHKIRNCLAREKMIAHGSSAWDLLYVLRKNLFFFFKHAYSLCPGHYLEWSRAHCLQSRPQHQSRPFLSTYQLDGQHGLMFVFLSQEV